MPQRQHQSSSLFLQDPNSNDNSVGATKVISSNNTPTFSNTQSWLSLSLLSFLLFTLQLSTTASASFVPSCTNIHRKLIKTTSTASPKMVDNNNNNRLDKGFNLLEIASSVVPQGKIVQGVKESWKFGWKRMMAELAPQDSSGMYQRPTYSFQGKIGTPTFPIEPDRYHLYVGNPCPWCHRTQLIYQLLNFEKDNSKNTNNFNIGLTELVDDPIKASRGGWIFSSSNKDPMYGCKDLRELYDKLSPGYKGRCTAPLLVDKKSKRIVSNESSDIVRMFNDINLQLQKKSSSMKKIDFYPKELSKQIDETEQWVYQLLNNGVYRCGFSTTQKAYERASNDVINGLNKCETILSKQNYLCSNDHITEADIYLLPTILRFDGVYSPLFKAGGCGTLKIRYDYPNIQKWLVRCWDTYSPGIQKSIDITDANNSYYKQLFPLNPGGILPYPPITAKALGLE